jgi:SAM-dependent methyltransferase
MKHVFYLFGVTATGKTTAAKKLAKSLSVPCVKVDDVYLRINCFLKDVLCLEEEDFFDTINPIAEEKYCPCIKKIINKKRIQYYNDILQKTADVFVVESSICTLKRDLKVIESIIGEHFKTFLYIDLSIDPWLNFLSLKSGESLEKLFANKEQWEKQYKLLIKRLEFPDFYYTFSHPSQIFTEYNTYQRAGFTDKKWQLLQMPQDFEQCSVLDLGTNSGWIADYCKKQNSGLTTGIDFNWRYLEDARMKGINVIQLNLNNFEELKTSYDYIFCLATIHYIEKQEEFIKHISTITNKQFVLEVPIAKNGEDFEIMGNRKIPSKAIVEKWLNTYFEKVELIGPSISPDTYTERLIYKAGHS